MSRHLLLYGPPGTGKTMFAKGLARQSGNNAWRSLTFSLIASFPAGLHYAIMTGGDVAPLGRDAVTEIHRLFDWAESTKRGVVLFVDEADAFLRKRSSGGMSEDLRNALNAFLYRTGEASRRVMVVFASNQPEQFDWAVNDRIDDMIHFDSPGLEERLRMLTQYVNKYILYTEPGAKPIIAEGVSEALLREVAMDTDGFSGREISKLVIAWQAAAYGTSEAKLDAFLCRQVLEEARSSKRKKLGWLSGLREDHQQRKTT